MYYYLLKIKDLRLQYQDRRWQVTHASRDLSVSQGAEADISLSVQTTETSRKQDVSAQ
jgi:hypothetical protein